MSAIVHVTTAGMLPEVCCVFYVSAPQSSNFIEACMLSLVWDIHNVIAQHWSLSTGLTKSLGAVGIFKVMELKASMMPLF